MDYDHEFVDKVDAGWSLKYKPFLSDVNLSEDAMRCRFLGAGRFPK